MHGGLAVERDDLLIVRELTVKEPDADRYVLALHGNKAFTHGDLDCPLISFNNFFKLLNAFTGDDNGL